MREENRITMVEARQIALQILVEAERDRRKFAEDEAGRGIQVQREVNEVETETESN
jgi:hypothetical protein